MGDTYPELVRAQALITETLRLEETRFRKTLEQGLGLLDEASGWPREGRRVPRRDRLQALRHLRLPARPDAGRAASRAASRSIPTASTRRWRSRRRRRARPGRARARLRPRRSGSRSSERAGATEFLGYDTETRRGRDPRDPQPTARRSTALKAGEEATLVAQPDAVLRRIGRPGRRRGRHQGCRGRAVPRHRHAEDAWATSSCMSAVSRAAPSSPATRSSSSSIMRGAPATARQSLRHPSPARGPAPGARRPRGAEGLAGRAGPAALRLRAHQADDAPTSSRRSRPWPMPIVLQNAPVETRLMALEDATRDGRHGAVRREIRRGGARRLDGRAARREHGSTQGQGQQGLFARAVRRHACAAHRRHRAHQA